VATRALEHGTLERHLVASAEVLEADATGVLLRTVAHRDPWPRGPFPPPPEEGSPLDGRLRIEAVGDRVLRVRYAPGHEVCHGGTGMIVGDGGTAAAGSAGSSGLGALPPASSVEVAATADRVVVRTPAMTAAATLDPYRLEVRGAGDARTAPSGWVPRVRIGGPDPSYFAVGDSLGTGVSHDQRDGRPVATETFGIGPGEGVYGFGETFLGLDKAGQTIDLWVSDAMGVHTPRLYKAVPFWLTTGGYGVFVHTSNRITAWVGSRAAHQVQVAVDDGVLDYFVFLGSPAEILAGYTALTGRPPVPPDWSFGWWQSRCSYASAEEVLEVVREMREAGIPMDVIHLDTNWFAVDWRCDLEFAPDRFPDPEGLCRALAAEGVHLSLWQTPYLMEGTRLHDRLARAGGFVRTRDGAFLDIGVHFVSGYQGPVHVVDWTNPEAVRVMDEEYGRLLKTGASVIKVDFGEELPDAAVYADGTPGERMHNLYPLRYQQAVHAATGRALGDAERIAWSRSGWAGAQRFPVHWGGDVPPAWEMMAPQLHGGLSLGLSGFTFWSADIGGTGELPHDHELLVRWLQWGVLLSHPRVHGMGIREACRWPEPARRVARDWIRLRYRLLPYVLAEARYAAERGLPFARPLVLEFPDDPTTWRIGDQFLCGRSILVAPLLEPGGRRRVYLPAGTWTDWWTRDRHRGPGWVDAEHDLDTMPLYLREGAVIPMGPVVRRVGERPTDPLTLMVAPFEAAGRTELRVPMDGRDVTIRYEAEAGRHTVEAADHLGEVVLDAPPGVEVRR
jgi:alpha-D-xyloside xylohydrolase